MASIANCECLPEIDCHRKNVRVFVRVYVRKNVRMSEYMMPFILPDDMSETIDYGRMVCQGGDHWKYCFNRNCTLFYGFSKCVNTLKHAVNIMQ